MRAVVHVFLVLGVTLASRSNGHSIAGHLSQYEHVTDVKEDTKYHGYAGLGSKTCMKDLGCFEITQDFINPTSRPLNFLPLDRALINTKFVLYTKQHPKEEYRLDLDFKEEIRNSPLDPTRRTAFIIHGFFDTRYYGQWVQNLKEDLLLYTDYNVIIVDWSKGNGAPYTQATANTRVVGAEVALMIEALKKYKDVNSMDIHIIGHSLGAHVAGYAGERINKLGRITGLDPAKPYFERMPPSVRLDLTDADFVDAIHTDSSSMIFFALGMSQTVGHVDFYPNNGMNQPGCSSTLFHSIIVEGLFDVARRVVACNHQRSVDFFSHSINNKKALPVAYKCPDYGSYLEGKCAECEVNNTNCAIMGIKADQYRPNKNDSKEVRMYISTSNESPFWEHTYQIKIKLHKSDKNSEQGKIFLQIQGLKNNFDVTLITKNENLVHGALYTFLVRRNETFGEIQNVKFGWKSSSWRVYKTHAISPEYVTIRPMNSGNHIIQKQQTKTFCNTVRKPCSSDKTSLLVPCELSF